MFKPKVDNQVYCSSRCRYKAARARWLAKPENVEKMRQAKRRWRAANPGYDARAQRDYYRRKKQREEVKTHG
jgi:hypothetical protein